ncbi:MAG: hypothetical protein AB2813_00725 [Candidatus Sedimenticola endophacoides]
MITFENTDSGRSLHEGWRYAAFEPRRIGCASFGMRRSCYIAFFVIFVTPFSVGAIEDDDYLLKRILMKPGKRDKE